ncbi:hypothetical protein [Agarivorans albus]|uniref:hypothetical protein n=1 Tax=Agarivorans albus TaxID=182262 RepID=UPI00058D367B|nr:hypothetical protein [Agarivorans albus]
MSNLQHKWMFGGAILLVAISSLMMATGVMKPWNPIPIYQVILAWIVSFFYLLFIPIIYLIEFKLISQSKHFLKIVTGLTFLLSLLSIKYFWVSWEYGYKYQGELHTKIVAIENLVGFSGVLGICFWAIKKESQIAGYVANLLFFSILAWCAFPYLG